MSGDRSTPAARALGLLHELPTAAEDLTDVAGLPGSCAHEGNPLAARDNVLAERLRATRNPWPISDRSIRCQAAFRDESTALHDEPVYHPVTPGDVGADAA